MSEEERTDQADEVEGPETQGEFNPRDRDEFDDPEPEGELDDLDGEFSGEQTEALGAHFDADVSETAMRDLPEDDFGRLLRDRAGEPLQTEDEIAHAFAAANQREAMAQFVEFARKERDRSRAAIAGLNGPRVEREEPVEGARAYGDLTGLSEQEINAVADARLIDSAPYAEQLGSLGQKEISSLRPTEVVEPLVILDEGRFRPRTCPTMSFGRSSTGTQMIGSESSDGHHG